MPRFTSNQYKATISFKNKEGGGKEHKHFLFWAENELDASEYLKFYVKRIVQDGNFVYRAIATIQE